MLMFLSKLIQPPHPVWFIWFLAVLPAAAEPPMLRPAVPIAANGAVIDMGSYAIPCVADWNGDGRKDLLVGHRSADKLAVFLNTGSNTVPVFGPASLVQANGVDIHVPGSGCGAPAPWVCDYDADGLRDLLVGDGSNGTIHFYRNINTNAQPLLAAGIQLRMGAAVLTVGARATPCVADWDHDGLNDLLCGDGNGNVSFFTGSDHHPPRHRTRLWWQLYHLDLSQVRVLPVLPDPGGAMKALFVGR